jgi:hypothetical protein
MALYLQAMPGSEQLFAWEFSASEARRIGVPNAEQSKSAYFKSVSDDGIWETLKQQTNWFVDGANPFHRGELQAGEFYFRMARPGANHFSGRNLVGPSARLLKNELAIAKSQLLVLVRQLQRICQTVHPSPETWNSYGHDIRNLLILACTEAESHWRSVLVANGNFKDRFSTNDYVKIAQPMKLGGYGITFPDFPWLNALRPFSAWGLTGRPTQELDWYDSYNAVKHDRENAFSKATLGHAFNAVSANAILIAAQFGFFDSFNQADFADAFHFTEFPQWDPSEVYVHLHEAQGTVWKGRNYPL